MATKETGKSGLRNGPAIVILGVAQDGGVPQAGEKRADRWTDPSVSRYAASLALVDRPGGGRWLFEATPDFRWQLAALDRAMPVEPLPGIDGLFLSHAHIGHYAGLIFLGRESMNAKDVPVYALPRLRRFLETNAPWEQLARCGNIDLRGMEGGEEIELNRSLRVTPFTVPHRQEYSETAAFRIEGPHRTALFLPDIDSWELWEEEGVRVEEMIARVDVAFLDGTFYDDAELPGRDRSAIPHPTITHSMKRFASLGAADRSKVYFIHINHTNKALDRESEERRRVESEGFCLAEEGMVFEL